MAAEARRLRRGLLYIGGDKPESHAALAARIMHVYLVDPSRLHPTTLNVDLWTAPLSRAHRDPPSTLRLPSYFPYHQRHDSFSLNHEYRGSLCQET